MSTKSLVDILDSERQKRKKQHRFGSDYYARLASNPSGGRTKENKEEQEVDTPVSELKLPEIISPTEPKLNKVTDERYTAVPARIVSDEEPYQNGKAEPIFRVEQTVMINETSDMETTVSEFTSDSDISYVHCYDVEKAEVSKKSPPELSKPNGILYRQTDDNDILLDIITRQLTDENKNTKYQNKEGEFEISILNSGMVPKQNDVEKPVKVPSKLNIVEMKLKNGKSTPPSCVPQSISQENKEEVQESKDVSCKAREIVNTVDVCNVEQPKESVSNIQIDWEEVSVSAQSSPRYEKLTTKEKVQRSNIVKKLDMLSAQNRARKLSQGELSEDGNVPLIVNKKSDNTIIKKIYSDPLVRTFAMQSRENLPIIFSEDNITKNEERFIRSSSAEPSDREGSDFSRQLHRSMSQSLVKENAVHLNRGMKRSASLAPNDDSDSASDYHAFSLGSFTSERTDVSKSSSHTADPEIDELKEKKLVRNILGAISKSYPNVSKISGVRLEKNVSAGQSTSTSSDNLNGSIKPDEVPISVKDLKKMFEHADTGSRRDRLIYSLTARSLSKQVRENLKNQNLDEPLSIEVVKCDTKTSSPEPISEAIEEPILDTGSKIKFYEQLK